MWIVSVWEQWCSSWGFSQVAGTCYRMQSFFERQSDRERDVIHVLFHVPDICSCLGWTRNCSLGSHMGGRGPSTWAIVCCPHSWRERAVSSHQPCDVLCWCARQRLTVCQPLQACSSDKSQNFCVCWWQRSWCCGLSEESRA